MPEAEHINRRRYGATLVMAGAGMALIDRVAILYLALPVALFFITWMSPVVGWPLAIAAVSGLLPLANGRWIIPPKAALIGALAIGLPWTILGGAGHFFYANNFDWVTRDAVFRDMVVHSLPVSYIGAGVAPVLLRAPIAYYVVPALIGKLTGVALAEFALFAWTALGVLIFLLQVLDQERRPKIISLIVLSVVLSSGLDILAQPDKITDITFHKEWWAVLYQYSATTTLLYWVPNHALPGWLAAALIYRCRDDARFIGVSAWLGALTLLWSPLVSIGLLPFFGLLAWQQFRAGWFRRFITPVNLVAAPLVCAISAIYLTASTGGIVSGRPPAPDLILQIYIYVMFVLLEFGVASAVLVYRYPGGIDPPFFVVALITLSLLPWTSFGPANDLVMRGSIPALAIILFAVVDGWARVPAIRHRSSLMLVVIVIGAVTPLSEMARAVLWKRWSPNLDRSLYDVTEGNTPNYLTALTGDHLLDRIVRRPVPSADCAEEVSPAPASGTVVDRRGTGPDRAEIVSDLTQDALVKIRTPDHGTLLLAYIRPGDRVAVDGLAAGPLEIDYEIGTKFSAVCEMFLDASVARLFKVPLNPSSGSESSIRLEPEASPETAAATYRLAVEGFLYD